MNYSKNESTEIQLPVFLWGKFLIKKSGSDKYDESKYQIIGGTSSFPPEWLEARRPNKVLIGNPLLTSSVDAYTFSQSPDPDYFVWSHYYFKEGGIWEQTGNRNFLFEKHTLIKKENFSFLDRILCELMSKKTDLDSYNNIFTEYRQLDFEKLRIPSDEKYKQLINDALEMFTKNDKIGDVLRWIYDRSDSQGHVNITNCDLGLRDRLNILSSLIAITPLELLKIFTFSTHSYLTADLNYLKFRFWEPGIPVERNSLSEDFRWIKSTNESLQGKVSTRLLNLINQDQTTSISLVEAAQVILENKSAPQLIEKLEKKAVRKRISSGRSSFEEKLAYIKLLNNDDINSDSELVKSIFYRAMEDTVSKKTLAAQFITNEAVLCSFIKILGLQSILNLCSDLEENKKINILVLILRCKPLKQFSENELMNYQSFLREWALSEYSQTKKVPSFIQDITQRKLLHSDQILAIYENLYDRDQKDEILKQIISLITTEEEIKNLFIPSQKIGLTNLSKIYLALVNDDDIFIDYQKLDINSKISIQVTNLAFKFQKFKFLNAKWASYVVIRTEQENEVHALFDILKKYSNQLSKVYEAIGAFLLDINYFNVKTLLNTSTSNLKQQDQEKIISGVITAVFVIYGRGATNYLSKFVDTVKSVLQEGISYSLWISVLQANKPGLPQSLLEEMELNVLNVFLITESYRGSLINDELISISKYSKIFDIYYGEYIDIVFRYSYEANVNTTLLDRAKFLLTIIENMSIKEQDKIQLYQKLAETVESREGNLREEFHNQIVLQISDNYFRDAYIKKAPHYQQSKEKDEKIKKISNLLISHQDPFIILNVLENSMDLGEEKILELFKEYYSPDNAEQIIKLKHALLSKGFYEFYIHLLEKILNGKVRYISPNMINNLISLMVIEDQETLSLIRAKLDVSLDVENDQTSKGKKGKKRDKKEKTGSRVKKAISNLFNRGNKLDDKW